MPRHRELSDDGYAARRKHTKDGFAVIGKSSYRDVTAEDVEARRDQLGDPANRRSRHVIGEIARTAGALAKNDFKALGPLMRRQPRLSLCDDFKVSCKELDLMVEIASTLSAEYQKATGITPLAWSLPRGRR